MSIRLIVISFIISVSMLVMLSARGSTAASNKLGAIAIGASGEDISAIANAGAVNIINVSAYGLSSANNTIWYQGLAGIAGTPEGLDQFGSALAAGDFNNDGFVDLAVGVIREGTGAYANAGAVNIIYGATGGLTSANNKIWYQGLDGIEGTLEADDYFGASLAAGDFNNDGFADLAIGVPRESIGGNLEAGAVNIIYGSAAGLISANNMMWYQGLFGIEGTLEAEDRFGAALAVGDFNNDGFADLAVGADAEASPVFGSAGAVNIIFGSAYGLTSANNKIWMQGLDGIEGDLEQDDRFGSSLATGDFNNDGFADLAVGVPYETIGPADSAGAVNIIFGSAGGLTAANNKVWYQGLEGIEETPETLDRFGSSLASGDFNNDGFADLAVGVIGESIGKYANAGAVNIIYGAAGGLTSANNKIWYQGLDGIEGTLEAGDYFGGALAAGYFNGDVFADLAVGVPVEGIGGMVAAGAVNIIYGAAGGLTSANNKMWYQGLNGIEGTLEQDDRFGASLVYMPPNPNAHFPWPMFLPAITGGTK